MREAGEGEGLEQRDAAEEAPEVRRRAKTDQLDPAQNFCFGHCDMTFTFQRERQNQNARISSSG